MSKSEPVDKELYNKIKKEVWSEYSKPSAYRSGQLVKRYKEAGGTFKGNQDKNSGLPKWFSEKWLNQRGEVGYKFKSDVYRPTSRITKDTPITFNELTKEQIERAKKEKYLNGRVNKFNI